MSVFGDLVKDLRRHRGWTLEYVARKIKSHKGYVSGIENDKVNPPSAKIVKRFARIFGEDMRKLLRLAAAAKVSAEVREEFLDFAMALSSPEERIIFLKKHFGIVESEKKEESS